ncbi:MAG: hypothetical protein HON25_04505 [Gammaproteobacteria bacterium]|jgi:hypothetical protein|nr:hypothetical protein [Gammaproteobacteria bacterium]MBT3696107.1 hypothetical protein [Gammaproteobacteria bacterium]MBT5333659.1 hypothetical protein [Gammaproteobacteria bacterium]MBT5682026.1 hypothetical protein [Gammaproteobacteria bacterium]MBT6023813.1 hypothetical protein [Gammaproteobacteria bacterium]
MRTLTLGLITLMASAMSQISLADGHLQSEKTSIANLSWMTGSWSGAMGPATLEENWTQAKSGTIASLVRLTTPEGTGMVEIVNIQEMDGTLVLHLQQWGPGFTALAPAQKMLLDRSGEHTVTFKAASPGGLKQLTYSRPADNEFEVAVITADDQNVTIKMTPIK